MNIIDDTQAILTLEKIDTDPISVFMILSNCDILFDTPLAISELFTYAVNEICRIHRIQAIARLSQSLTEWYILNRRFPPMTQFEYPSFNLIDEGEIAITLSDNFVQLRNPRISPIANEFYRMLSLKYQEDAVNWEQDRVHIFPAKFSSTFLLT